MYIPDVSCTHSPLGINLVLRRNESVYLHKVKQAITNHTNSTCTDLFVADIFAEVFEKEVSELLVEDLVECHFSHLLQVLVHDTSNTGMHNNKRGQGRLDYIGRSKDNG